MPDRTEKAVHDAARAIHAYRTWTVEVAAPSQAWASRMRRRNRDLRASSKALRAAIDTLDAKIHKTERESGFAPMLQAKRKHMVQQIREVEAPYREVRRKTRARRARWLHRHYPIPVTGDAILDRVAADLSEWAELASEAIELNRHLFPSAPNAETGRPRRERGGNRQSKPE